MLGVEIESQINKTSCTSSQIPFINFQRVHKKTWKEMKQCDKNLNYKKPKI